MIANRPTAGNKPGSDSPPDGAGGLAWLAAEVEWPVAAGRPVLAVGAESKGAFCLARGGRAWLSRDFGPLSAVDNYRTYRRAVTQAEADLDIHPELVARDLHPGYVSTDYAASRRLPTEVIQHHHAHVAACLAEHRQSVPVIGICCDGAGCGVDKASWGCEVIWADNKTFARMSHLRYFGLPGADTAAVQAWRAAWGVAADALGSDMPEEVGGVFGRVPAAAMTSARRMLAWGVQAPLTSSLGRLFDAMAFLLGLGTENDKEGQLARALQAAAEGLAGEPWPVELGERDGVEELDFRPAVREMVARRRAGRGVSQLAADFHETIAGMLSAAARRAAQRHAVGTVVLTGGCFFNRILAERLARLLAEGGLTVLEHRRVSCGDAGLPLGQALVAAARASALDDRR